MMRFFVIVLAVYFAFTILRKILRILIGYFHPSSISPQQDKPLKTKENYKDVKDAKFTELPNKQTEENQDSPT